MWVLRREVGTLHFRRGSAHGYCIQLSQELNRACKEHDIRREDPVQENELNSGIWRPIRVVEVGCRCRLQPVY